MFQTTLHALLIFVRRPVATRHFASPLSFQSNLWKISKATICLGPHSFLSLWPTRPFPLPHSQATAAGPVRLLPAAHSRSSPLHDPLPAGPTRQRPYPGAGPPVSSIVFFLPLPLPLPLSSDSLFLISRILFLPLSLAPFFGEAPYPRVRRSITSPSRPPELPSPSSSSAAASPY